MALTPDLLVLTVFKMVAGVGFGNFRRRIKLIPDRRA